MPVFSKIARGIRARKRGIECTTVDGVPFRCDLRAVTAEEEAQVLEAATRRALAAGAKADEKDLVFQFAYATELVAVACVDEDSPEDAPRPFFDGGVEQVRQHLDRDRVLLLSETQRAWQESVSPRKRKLSTDEFFGHVISLAAGEEGEDHPFWIWPRSTQESLLRSMARLLLSSQTDKSPTSSGDEAAAEH